MPRRLSDRSWRLAQAGSDEPSKPGAKKKPGSDEPAKPGAKKKTDEPSAPSKGTGAATPAAKPSDEPGKGGSGSDEPGKSGGTDEPNKGGGKGEPAGGPPTVAKKASAKVQYGIGLHVRAIFVHQWLLNLFLDESTNLNSVAFGGEFIRRKGNFDLIASVDFGFYSPANGNYLGNGKNPAVDTDYIDFRGLNVLSFSVHFIWHHYFTNWLSLVWGAGVGLGIVLGEIWRISNQGCTVDNAGDENTCYPRSLGSPKSPEQWAEKCTKEGSDSVANPCFYKEDDVWPVVPMIHLLIGLNFKISEQFSVRLDGGFRNAFYIGTTGHYFF